MISGVYNADLSDVKHETWDLSNGAQVIVEYNPTYGDMITRIERRRKVWHCSDGLKTCPRFARPWIEVVVVSADIKIVRPGFKK